MANCWFAKKSSVNFVDIQIFLLASLQSRSSSNCSFRRVVCLCRALKKKTKKSPGPSIFYESERDIRHCYDRFQRTRMGGQKCIRSPVGASRLFICLFANRCNRFWKKSQIIKCEVRIKALDLNLQRKSGETAPQKGTYYIRPLEKRVALKAFRTKNRWCNCRIFFWTHW